MADDLARLAKTAAQKKRLAERLEGFVLDGVTLDAQVAEQVTGGELVRTMDGASSLTLEIHDPGRLLLQSGLLVRAAPKKSVTDPDKLRPRLGKVRCNLDGVAFRLAGVRKDGDTLTLTFEDEVAALLRQHSRRLKLSRARHTRAQAVAYVAREVKEIRIPYTIQDPGKKQPIASVDDENQDGTVAPREQKKARREKIRAGGLSRDAKITVKKVPASREQRDNIAVCLAVANEVGANELAIMAMLCAGIGESSFLAIPNGRGSDYGGVFQGKFKGTNPQFTLNDTNGMATSFLKGGKGFQGGGAIALAKASPNMRPGQIALTVEGSRPNFGSDAEAINFYDRHKGEAQAILEAAGGARDGGSDGTGTTTRSVRESYTYYRGEPGGDPEDSWECTARWAEEVNWRRFATGNRLYFASDDYFLRSTPQAVVTEDSDGVERIDFDIDYAAPVSTVNLTVRADRWGSPPPGATVLIRGLGLVDDTWIVWEDRQPLASRERQIELRRPAPATPDPAATRRTVTVAGEDATTAGAGGAGGAGKVSGAFRGSPVAGQRPHAATHETAGLPGYPAFDYMAPAGTPCLAPVDGNITRLSGHSPSAGGAPGGPLGYSIYMTGGGKSYFMTHLDKVLVKAGQTVSQGEQIAEVAAGPPSWSTPHVHMGVRG